MLKMIFGAYVAVGGGCWFVSVIAHLSYYSVGPGAFWNIGFVTSFLGALFEVVPHCWTVGRLS